MQLSSALGMPKETVRMTASVVESIRLRSRQHHNTSNLYTHQNLTPASRKTMKRAGYRSSKNTGEENNG
jgi:dolichyl-phosphate-mannose--protein O-mannosyl transferase